MSLIAVPCDANSSFFIMLSALLGVNTPVLVVICKYNVSGGASSFVLSFNVSISATSYVSFTRTVVVCLPLLLTSPYAINSCNGEEASIHILYISSSARNILIRSLKKPFNDPPFIISSSSLCSSSSLLGSSSLLVFSSLLGFST